MNLSKPTISEDAEIAALAKRYGPAVQAFLRRRLGDPAAAEDLTQEVFTALLRRSEAEPIRDPERYIFQIAANLIRDDARRRRRRPVFDSTGFADPDDRLVDTCSPERELAGRQAYVAFVEALQELPERTRTVFVLNRFEDMTGREIAAKLGVSQRLVEYDLARALKLFRERLQ